MLFSDPTRYWCRAFFVAVAVISGVLVAAFALAGSGVLLTVSGVVALGSVILAIRADKGTVAPLLYRLFVSVTRAVGRAVRGFAQVACFIVVTAAGMTGSTVEVARPARRSMWLPKRSMEPDAYAAPYAGRDREPTAGWARGYVAWARHSGNRWVLPLLPFLLLQRSAQTQDESEVRGEIYTLY